MSEHLLLKWGTLKAWTVESDAAKAALQKYFEGNVSGSAICQHDTPEQKAAICELIDALDIEFVYSDWSGEAMTKDEAKRYVLEYGRDA